jgi:hypothetical protein
VLTITCLLLFLTPLLLSIRSMPRHFTIYVWFGACNHVTSFRYRLVTSLDSPLIVNLYFVQLSFLSLIASGSTLNSFPFGQSLWWISFKMVKRYSSCEHFFISYRFLFVPTLHFCSKETFYWQMVIVPRFRSTVSLFLFYEKYFQQLSVHRPRHFTSEFELFVPFVLRFVGA